MRDQCGAISALKRVMSERRVKVALTDQTDVIGAVVGGGGDTWPERAQHPLNFRCVLIWDGRLTTYWVVERVPSNVVLDIEAEKTSQLLDRRHHRPAMRVHPNRSPSCRNTEVSPPLPQRAMKKVGKEENAPRLVAEVAMEVDAPEDIALTRTNNRT